MTSTDLFPTDPDARYAGTELETSAERAARVGTESAMISVRDHLHVIAYQAERYAQFAEQTARTIAAHEVTRAEAARQSIEDVRANRRNRNRFVALVVALVLGFAAPTLCHALGIPLQYSFCVVVLLDSGVTLYAMIRRY